MAIKLTKNEQKLQKDRLKQYQRYLPTLQLKKQQLQAVITKTKADLEQKEVERAQMIGDLTGLQYLPKTKSSRKAKSWITWFSRIPSSVRMRTSPVSPFPLFRN